MRLHLLPVSLHTAPSQIKALPSPDEQWEKGEKKIMPPDEILIQVIINPEKNGEVQ